MGKSRQSADLVSDSNIFVDIANDRVGIGTTVPQYDLDVVGNINFTGTFNQNGSLFVASRWSSGTGDNIYRLNGNVGIGTTNPTQNLQVVGNTLVSGSVTATSVTATSAIVGSAVTLGSGGINVAGVVTATSAIVGSAVTLGSGGVNVAGVVTATSYRGDGSQLSGISLGTDITSCLFT